MSTIESGGKVLSRSDKACISQLSPVYTSVTTTPKSLWLTTSKGCLLSWLPVGIRLIAGVLCACSIQDPAEDAEGKEKCQNHVKVLDASSGKGHVLTSIP